MTHRQQTTQLGSSTVSDYDFRPDHLYHIITKDNAHCVIHVHRILESNQAKSLSDSTYVFQDALPPLSTVNDGSRGEGRLLLQYTEWSKAGTESGSEELPLERIAKVIAPCSVKIPGSLLGIQDVEEELMTFNVRWAISTLTAYVEIRNMAFKPENITSPGDLTKIASPTAVDLHCSMGGLSLAFASVGVKILAGVDNMLASASTWQVHRTHVAR
jgi:hypothetical protein